MKTIITKSIIFRLLFLFFFLGLISNTYSQSFYKIEKKKNNNEISFKINKDEFIAKIGINSEARTPKINFSGKGNYTYNSLIQDAVLDFEVFTNSKSNRAYLIINNYKEYSHGAELFLIEKGSFKHIGQICIAAYMLNEKEKMDYCSILKHITILETTQKTYISFETPLIVINPGQHDEEILKGNKLYYTLESGKLIQNRSN